MAYDRIHSKQPAARVGLATNYLVFHAASENPLDRWLTNVYHELFNLSSLHLLQNGELPSRWWLPAVRMPEVQGKIDFIGLNVYNRLHVRFPYPLGRNQGPGGLFVPRDVPQGDRGVELPYGEAHPKAVSHAVRDYAKLGKPLLVLENGVPDQRDRIRPWVMVNTLREISGLIQQGFDVRGYFHWSLVDNFEWNEGWTLRFGLYELDHATQARTPRPSAKLYRDIIALNGLSPEVLAEHAEAPSQALL